MHITTQVESPEFLIERNLPSRTGNPGRSRTPRFPQRQLRHSCLLALALAGAGLAWAHDDAEPAAAATNAKHDKDRLIFGESSRVDGGRVSTWAVVTSNGKIEEVGVTIPLRVFINQPDKASGPLGAIAVLQFPEVVRQATFFNHFELHSNAMGHMSPPFEPNRYMVPHFDFHFYSLPAAVVWGIPALPPGPSLPAVPADRLPVGWLQPGGSEAQMGRHSVPASILPPAAPFAADMIAGFLPSGGQMHFIEPMITTAKLVTATDFVMPVPQPKGFGRAMLYPQSFSAEYDAQLRAYHFVFRQFVTVD